jgi:hypothetical protein
MLCFMCHVVSSIYDIFSRLRFVVVLFVMAFHLLQHPLSCFPVTIAPTPILLLGVIEKLFHEEQTDLYSKF